jgi:large subunit ribosomal protein L15
MVEKKKDKTTAGSRAKSGSRAVSAKASSRRAAARTPKAPAAPSKPEKTRRAAKRGAEAATSPAAPPRARRAVTDTRPAAAGPHDLRPSPGATHARKRVGRGPGSGHGKTAGRGHKGQKSRSGYRHLRGFEGGQMPLHRRVPKRGFTNIFRVEYDVVNLRDLDRFESGAAITPEALADQRLAGRGRPVKILGDGELSKPLQVSAHRFSASAKARIEAAGGRCEVIPR